MLSNDKDLWASMRNERTSLGSRLTLYCDLMDIGGQMVIEKVWKIDQFAELFLLRPRSVTALRLDLQAHSRCRRNVPTYVQVS